MEGLYFYNSRWYDGVGNPSPSLRTGLLQIADYKAGPQTQAFTYDDADRILSGAASGGGGGNYSESYAYNAITGNLSSKAGVTYTYGDANHKHAVTATSNGYTFSYDSNGNMTGRTVGGPAYTLAYDAENHLSGVSGGTTATFFYDGDGKRVKATVGGTTTIYIGDYFEWTGSASTMIKYFSANGSRIAMRVGATRYFLLSDHLGSTTITASESGTKLGELRYRAWGEQRYAWGTTYTKRHFTGQYKETSLGGVERLYFYNARWVDVALGRFTQPDSIIPEPGDPQAWDRFAYSFGNPVKYIDPDGHWPCSFSSSGFSCSVSTFGLGPTIDRAGEKLFGVKNASDVLSNAMSTFSLGADVAAEALDIAASTIVATGTVIGATSGAAITLPGGGTAVVSGAAGASVGWAMAEIGVRPLIFGGNLLASASTISIVGSELILGDTGYGYTLDVGSEGTELSGRVAIGSGSQVSTLATSAGWVSPIAYPSLLIQTGAVLGNLGVISPPPINLKFNLQWWN